LLDEVKKLHPMIDRNINASEKWSLDQQTEPVAANLGGEGRRREVGRDYAGLRFGQTIPKQKVGHPSRRDWGFGAGACW
jgi:hypothetical protein